MDYIVDKIAQAVLYPLVGHYSIWVGLVCLIALRYGLKFAINYCTTDIVQDIKWGHEQVEVQGTKRLDKD